MLTRRATLAGLAALGFPFAADAQGFPSRSITIIVPYPPGGPVDALARLIAQESAGDLNQPIVVENRPGGSGVIGTQAVARAEPDGHMLVLGTNQTHATNQSLIKNCPYDAVKDFVPVAGIAAMPHVLVVRNSLALTSVGDVVAMAKANRAVSRSDRPATAPAPISPANCSRPRLASTCCMCPSRGFHPCSRSCSPTAST